MKRPLQPSGPGARSTGMLANRTISFLKRERDRESLKIINPLNNGAKIKIIVIPMRLEKVDQMMAAFPSWSQTGVGTVNKGGNLIVLCAYLKHRINFSTLCTS